MSSFILRYKGVFDLQGLISTVTGWFEKLGYETYIYQTKSKVTAFGTEEEFGIRGWMNETEYHRLKIDVYFKMFDVTPVEVVQDGEKRELTKAAVEATGSGQFITDFSDRFEGSTFMQKLKQFMEKRIINERYDTIWKDNFHYRVQELNEVIKRFFDMSGQGKYW